MKLLIAVLVIRLIIELVTSNKRNKETMYREKKSILEKHPAEFQLR